MKSELTIPLVPVASAEIPVELYIGKPEVAKRLNKTLRTIDNWMARGILPYYKIGRSVGFKWSEIESHLAQTCRVRR
jgi:excisionase family DNA binding protein